MYFLVSPEFGSRVLHGVLRTRYVYLLCGPAIRGVSAGCTRGMISCSDVVVGYAQICVTLACIPFTLLRGKGAMLCRIVLVCSRVECPTYVLTEYILHTYIDATQTPAVTKQGPVNQSLE